MTKHLRLLIGSIITVVLVIGLVFTYSSKETTSKNSITQQREKYADYLKNSPFKESLTWDKKKRKLKGLPPNRYYEQMWELTINPATGKLDDGNISVLREQLHQQHLSERNPGESGNNWEERGPNNVGGRTRVILFDPNDSSNNTVYAGGVSGGLWVNTNITSSGSSWSRVQNVPGNLSVTSITVDPRDSDTWYIGTGEQYTAGDVVGNGVYMTTDGGTNWSALTIPDAGGGDIVFSATNLFLSGIYYINDVLAWDNGTSTELFVAVGAHVYGDSSDPANWLGLQSSGLYHSADGGSNWNRIESSNMQHTFSGLTYYYIPNDLEVGADNKLWMGTIGSALGEGGGRVYSSTNGSSWTEAAASPLTDANRVELEPSATNANKIYALVEGNSSPLHIYETTNAFGSISSLSLPNDADTGIAANDFARGQAFYDLVIEADPANDDIFYVGGIDLFKTTNGGSSWSQLSHWYGGFGHQEVHADQHSIAFGNNSSSRMMFGNDGGLYYSNNSGNTISVRNNGYNVTQFVKAGIGPDGVGDTDGIFSAGAQDNGTQAFRNTTSGVNSSEELSDGDGFYTFVDKDGQYMIATYVRNVIYRFNLPWNGLGRIDGGATTLVNDQSTGDFVNPMGYDSDANRLLTNNSTSSSNSIRSINVASNSNGAMTNSALTASPTAFRASPFANNTWYVGLGDGSLIRLTNVSNNSATWTSLSTPFVGSVSSVRFGETANDIIVTIHNYGVTSVWYSSNAGSSWTSKEGNLPNIPVRDFLLNPLNTNEAIIATQLGVWSTANFNAANPTWTQAYNGMSDVSVTSLDYWNVSGDHTDNKVIASTYGRGVFTGQFTATAVPDTEAPSTPTSLVSTNITQSSVDLSWNASTDNVGVTAYDVYQGGSVIATVSGTTHQVTGLNSNTSYNFSVRAKDSAGNESAASNTLNVTTTAPDTEAPTAPTSLSSSNITDSSVSLSWNASTDNVGVTSYDVLQSTTVIATVSSTTHQVNGLSANTGYTFSVRANDDAGNVSPISNEVSITTDAIPITYCSSNGNNVSDEYIQRVQIGSIDNSSGSGGGYSDHTSISTDLDKDSSVTITITPLWTGTIYNEAYSVWIDYNKDGDFTDSGEQVWSQSANQNTPVSGTFTVPSSAVSGTTRMRVSMKYNGIPSSCESFQYGEVEDYTVNLIEAITDTEAPSTPSSLSTSNTTETTTDLSWNASTDNVGVTGYDVYQGGSVIATVSGTTHQVTGLSVNTAYSFSVRAKDNAGNESAASNTVNITTPDTTAPTAPTSLSASNIGLSSVDLSWNSSSDNVGVTGYDVYQGATVIATISGTSHQVSGLSENTAYTFTVIAVDNAGNESSASNAVNITTLFNDTQAPTAPSNLTASNITQSSVDLSWDASSDNVGVTAYDVYQGATVIATVSGTSHQVSGLTINSSYSFFITAKDAVGNESGDSNTVSVTIVDTQAPTTPTSLSASNITQTSVDLSWNASSDNVGVTAYNVYQGASVIATISGTSHQVTGLSANTNYAFSVTASDSAGNTSSASNTLNVTTLNDGSNTGCSGGITSFPYTEGFESGIGAWTQNTNDDLNWTVDANGTPSSSTGPSSAFEGNNYIFVEVSGNNTGYPTKQAILTSPCFDLSGLSQANFNFNYHMYGANDLGSISVELSDDDGVSWTSIWNESGSDQGNTWQSVSLNLDAYVGGSIQLRLNRISGDTWQADIAIDNIQLTDGSAPDLSCTGGISSFPYSESFESGIGAWEQSNGDDLNWTRDSNGTPSSSTGPSNAADGSFYMYTEVSGNNTGYPNKQSIFNSPCFDLSGESTATFNFNYHMYGASNMGDLIVEASNDSGASWTNIWNQSGNLGNSWQSASINLDAYVGAGVQLRFNSTSGTTWQGDIAIDNITLSTNNPPVANNSGQYGSFVSATENFDLENALKVQLFPNPATQHVTINIGQDKEANYMIVNMLGQTVLQGKISIQETLDVENLRAGTYIIEITNDDNVVFKKFIKH